jgi:hypothetical protein
MTKCLFLTAVLTCFTLTIHAQSTDVGYPKAEVFIGYSQNRIKVQTVDVSNFPRIEHVGFNGFEAEGTYNVNRLFGIAADLSAHYHTETSTPLGTQQRVKSSLYNFLIGPVLKLRNKSRGEPFVHALFGAAHIGSSPSGLVHATDSQTDFAMAFGGGLDIRVAKHIEVRAFEADYNPTFFERDRQDNIRLSFGLIFKY